MSKTPTFGTPFAAFSHASMPWRFAGLWSGARGMHFAMSFFAAAVSFAGAENLSPPWTTRWPIASSSEREAMTPTSASVRTAMTWPMAAT